MYHVRRVKIGKTSQLDELAHECGLTEANVKQLQAEEGEKL